MSRFVEIFKKHPWWIAGAVLAVVILIWYVSRGSSTPQMAVYNSGPTDAQVQGAYALQAAQITANATVASAQLANEKSANDNSAAVQINSQNVTAATTINSQNTGAATTINSQNANAAVTIAGYQRDAEINGQNSAVEINNSNNQTSLVASLLRSSRPNATATITGANGQPTTVRVDQQWYYGDKGPYKAVS